MILNTAMEVIVTLIEISMKDRGVKTEDMARERTSIIIWV